MIFWDYDKCSKMHIQCHTCIGGTECKINPVLQVHSTTLIRKKKTYQFENFMSDVFFLLDSLFEDDTERLYDKYISMQDIYSS